MDPETKDQAFMDQFRCPKGAQGMIVAEFMNKIHSTLSTWGLRYAKIEPEYVILDVGCGGGKNISRLAKKANGGKVYGLDYSPDMVEFSKGENRKLIEQGKVEVVEGSVENMKFPDNSFDLVTAVETYYFWRNIPKAILEIKRVLKPTGKLLIISEMIIDGDYEVKNADMIKKAHVRLLPSEEIQSMLQFAGFAEVKAFRKNKSAWNAILAEKPIEE
jgi:SAM-dependent methyltransferase